MTANPDATVSLTAAALGLLAAHRTRLDAPGAGVHIEGDRDLAAALLGAITMPPVHERALRQHALAG